MAIGRGAVYLGYRGGFYAMGGMIDSAGGAEGLRMRFSKRVLYLCLTSGIMLKSGAFPMIPSYYRTAHALYPLRHEMWGLEYLYEPLPVPEDHPELDLFGFRREVTLPEMSPVGRTDETSPEVILGEPLKARMLNEFVYCPRLFYYEQVEGVFLDNADTERGSAIHEKIDRGRGALPKARKKAPPEGLLTEPPGLAPIACEVAVPVDAATEGAGATPKEEKGEGAGSPEPRLETIHSRSAMMSSERLGVVAKMDIIEVQMSHEPAAFGTWLAPPVSPASAPGTATASLPPGPVVSPAKAGKRNRRDAGEPDLFSQAVAADAPAAPVPLTETTPAARLLHVELKQAVIQKVTPVDYKAGAPRLGEDAHELWDADKMQLGLQILILRDNGYTCEEGVIYYRATKQRVKLVMTPEVESWILRQITAARKLAVSPVIPPPLVNSPKCVRCSLAPVCLPDETRLLTLSSPAAIVTDGAGEGRLVSADKNLRTPAMAPRRLIAARDDERALYLNTQGCRVGLKSERLIIKDGDSVIDEIRLNDVTHVSLFGNIQLSTQAIQELCQQEIPVAYFSMGGWFYGLTRGHGLKNVHTRIRQFAVAANPVHCLALARKIVQAKIRNHRTLLMRLHVEPPPAAIVGLKEISMRVPGARGLDELLGMEGAAAALYFKNFPGMIKAGAEDLDDEIPGLDIPASAQAKRKSEAETFTFDFTQRRRRPPTDPVNALLSLAYSLLAKDCTIAALAVGFDPYVGFYHQPRHGRPALALDLMEEFRPLIAESAVLTAINNRMITPGHFVRAGDAVNLTPHGRKAFFHAYEQRMNTVITHPVFDYKVSYRRVLELQARLLARCLTGEIPEYVPMVTR